MKTQMVNPPVKVTHLFGKKKNLLLRPEAYASVRTNKRFCYALQLQQTNGNVQNVFQSRLNWPVRFLSTTDKHCAKGTTQLLLTQ